MIKRTYKQRNQMAEDEIENLKPMIDKDGNWLYDENYILILEDGLPYYTVEERNKRNQGFEKAKEHSISLMDGLIPDPSLSKQKIDELVNQIIKLEKLTATNQSLY